MPLIDDFSRIIPVSATCTDTSRTGMFDDLGVGQAPDMHDVRQLIDGTWEPGHSGPHLTILAPANGEPVTRVRFSSSDDVSAAVRAAPAAAPGWAATAAAGRAAALHAAAT